jgi:hypothetical protein
MTAKMFNVVVGTWLVVSAYAWPHDERMLKATIACGLLIVALSIASLFSDRLPRYLTVGVALILMLFSSAHVGRHDPVFWNNVAVAFVASATTLVRAGGEPELAT